MSRRSRPRTRPAAPTTLATAQAEAAARATEVAALQAQQVNAQVTATALAVVAANSVLDPNRQTITIQTDLEGMLANDEEALADARDALNTQLSRYPVGCRAGFALISGKAPEIDEGVELARRVEGLLREVRPEVFTEATGVELFALPNTQPFGEARSTSSSIPAASRSGRDVRRVAAMLRCVRPAPAARAGE